MLSISRVLGELIEEHVRLAAEGNRDCRLLVPGLTQRIAQEVHRQLLGNGINSYLVIGEGENPSEDERLIRAIGLTSVRIGSFVAIASPGQLIHVQDSIRGSGGTIRSLAFSEEWPWIDNGSEQFQFNGPVLEALVQGWSTELDTQKWLHDFVLDGLLEHTRSCPQRGQVFLEEIIGSFDPTSYPEIIDVREKLLCHAGIPRSSNSLSGVGQFIRRSSSLCRKIVDHCQRDTDVRESVRNRISELASDDEIEDVRLSMDTFLDGVGRSTNLDLGLIAFHGCWGNDRNDASHWLRLHDRRLEGLLGVSEQENAWISFQAQCDRGIVSENGRQLATFIGEQVNLNVEYHVPVEQFGGKCWLIRVLNRQQTVSEQALGENEGTACLQFSTEVCGSKYSRKVPLRVAIVSQDTIQDYKRLDLHLCGVERPTFTAIIPGFQVLDAAPANDEETPDKKVILDEPVHLFLFDYSGEEAMLSDEDDVDLGLIETGMPGIWRSAQQIDLSATPSGREVRVCSFGDSTAVICFESAAQEKGEFTIEDELRVSVSRAKGKHLGSLIDLFAGRNHQPYPALGRLDAGARRRTMLAEAMTARTGWRPILANLFASDPKNIGFVGDFFGCLGAAEAEMFEKLTLPEPALSCLRTYSEAREAVLKQIGTGLEMNGTTVDHPTYASHPIYVHERRLQMEGLLCSYLKAYRDVLAFVQNARNDLEWSQLLALIYLDCVVHWDGTNLGNTFFLIGPWHPLVVAKRFMVQAALFARGERLCAARGHAFSHLTNLLGQVQGFRWVPSLAFDGTTIEPAFVSTSSDPGWHLAFKTTCSTLASQEGIRGLAGIADSLWSSLGIQVETGVGDGESLVYTSLSSFQRAYPSRRSIGIRVRRGYVEDEVIGTIDQYLHTENGFTDEGERLPGGIRLYLEERPYSDYDARCSTPPLYVYQFDDDTQCVKEGNPDVYLAPPINSMSFRTGTELHKLPRGTAYQSVFYHPLRWVTEGQTLVPNGAVYESDVADEFMLGIGGAFVGALGSIQVLCGDPVITVTSVDLPLHLAAPWVVFPGQSIDPAILVKYVRDGIDRAIEERALWDYKLDVAGKGNSSYILSNIPKGFQIAVNGFFGVEDIASGFIVELGKIGLAIGGEALRSGRHALGVVGLVGAVRLLVGKAKDGESPLYCGPEGVGFLIPVDSFASFFGKSGEDSGKRTDLLALQLVLPNNRSGRIKISACGIESKFVSGTFSNGQARSALSQGLATASEFRELVEASLGDGAMPERLALLKLVSFGMRVISPITPGGVRDWVDTERFIYQAILAGDYEYSAPSHGAVVVSTEGGLPGVAECSVLEEGLWLRLTKGHWPGARETARVDDIRKQLCRLFRVPDCPASKSAESSSSTDAPEPKESVEVLPLKESAETLPNVGGSSERQSRPQMPEENELSKPLKRIFLGVDEARRVVYFDPQSPVDPLDNMNVMVTGSSGTGKTQLLKYLICQLREQDKNVLVLDFKNDFASDGAFCERARLERVFVAFDGLPYNPLIPYPVKHPASGESYIQCAQYIAGAADVLKETYKLGAQQQVAVKNAIVAAFGAAGISTSGSIPFSADLRFPDFSNVGESLQTNNPSAYNRLDPLFTLGLFPEQSRSQSFHALVNRAAVLDLSQIPSDQIKSALAQLIVLSAHAYFNSQPHSGSIRQILVFDEAHRVLESDYMLSLIRECRAYGVGTVLSSQYPSDFPGEISASMATKILHGNGRDNERVKAIVQLIGCSGREGDVAGLERFQAFVDSRHSPHTLLRTMNYPLYLVWLQLLQAGTMTQETLARAAGIDTSKLPIGNLVRQLELLGLAEEREGQVIALRPGGFAME